MQQAGIPERSVLINDVYIGYDRVEPTGGLLAFYADMAAAIDRLATYDLEDPEYAKQKNLLMTL